MNEWNHANASYNQHNNISNNINDNCNSGKVNSDSNNVNMTGKFDSDSHYNAMVNIKDSLSKQ